MVWPILAALLAISAATDGGAVPLTEAPPTIAVITPGRIPEHSGEDLQCQWTYVPVLKPLATYKDGRWLPGGAYDDSLTYDVPRSSSEEKVRFWKELQSQTFYGLYDETLLFVPTHEHVDLGGDQWVGGLRGIFSSDRLLDTDKRESVLVTNRKALKERPLPTKELQDQSMIVAFVNEALRPQETELVGKPYAHGFERELAQPPVLQQALRFDISEDRKAVFVHFIRHYIAPDPGEEDSRDEYHDFWKGYYYGVFEIGPSGTYKPLWQHADMHNDLADDRIYY